MRVDLRNNKDVLAGLLFILIGAFAVLIAADYPMGSAKRMGPGYFPMVLGAILCLFGAVLTVRGLLKGEKVSGGWGWKPVALLTFSLVLFGFIVTRLGLIPALAVMFFVSALAGREFRFTEVLLLTAVMSVFAVGVFVVLLKMPFQLIAGF
jgi:hypothetical protein